jgi:hypothetical protein
MTAMEKLTWYRRRIANIPTGSLRNTSRRPLHPFHCLRIAHLFPDDRLVWKQFCERLPHQRTMDEFSAQTKHAIRVRQYSSPTTATSGHGIILMLSINVSASAFGLEPMQILSRAHICWQSDYLDIYRGSLEICLCEPEDVVSAQRSTSTLWNGRRPLPKPIATKRRPWFDHLRLDILTSTYVLRTGSN